MKHILRTTGWFLLAGLTLSTAQADEVGRVINTTPITRAVTVQQQVCVPQQVTVQPQKSGAGALMGAIAGGAVGNNVGKGSGRALATGIGLIGGAILGDSIEGEKPAETRTVQQCSTENVVENRVTGYHVNYEYAGKQYSTQMSSDPGPFLRLQIVPVGPATLVPVGANGAPVTYPVQQGR
jgi:uncharacterized protein YcfJ